MILRYSPVLLQSAHQENIIHKCLAFPIVEASGESRFIQILQTDLGNIPRVRHFSVCDLGLGFPMVLLISVPSFEDIMDLLAIVDKDGRCDGHYVCEGMDKMNAYSKLCVSNTRFTAASVASVSSEPHFLGGYLSCRLIRNPSGRIMRRLDSRSR